MSFGGGDNGAEARAQNRENRKQIQSLSNEIATIKQTNNALRTQIAQRQAAQSQQNENRKQAQDEQKRRNRRRFLLTGNPVYNQNMIDVNNNDSDSRKPITLGAQ